MKKKGSEIENNQNIIIVTFSNRLRFKVYSLVVF